MPFKAIERVDKDGLSAKLDAELFGLMHGRELNPEMSKAAWAEFYKRHSTYLWNCCLKVCRSAREGDKLAKDIFQSTMHKVFEHSRTFNPDKSINVKSWIGRIAFNEFIDFYNQYNKRFVFYEETPEVQDESEVEFDEVEIENTLLSIKIEQLHALLSNLTSKEFKILMTYMTYYQIDNPNAHLPDSEMEKLCTEFGIQSDAVRQIKRRAILKLKKLAEALNK